jgi:hypothetical protein
LDVARSGPGPGWTHGVCVFGMRFGRL